MNILLSYNWLKDYLKTDLSAEAFAQKTTNAGNSVEHLKDLGASLRQVVVGKIVRVNAHPNADKLRVCEVEVGNGTVEIVCGGSNLIEGHKVAVALPGAKVRWHGEGDLVEIVESTLRGVKSYGMICSVDEIGFESLPHEEREIWDVTALTTAPAGTPLAEALGLDDVIMDVEVTSNRPDCMGVIGQAREGAAVVRGELHGYHTALESHVGVGAAPVVRVEESGLCPAYAAVRIEGVRVGPSPWWLQKRLLLAGIKPVNNVVDITNFVRQEYAQPMHVFDAQTLGGKELVVRRARAGETLVALDGKTYTLSESHLVIADQHHPVAIAGVMGGSQTGATEKTMSIIFESATFDPVSIRKTARSLNLYSDSQLLFEKGLSTQAVLPALYRAIELVREVMGEEIIVSPVATQVAAPYEPRVFTFHPGSARALMGIEVSDDDMLDVLARLGFDAKKEGDGYLVSVPFWRDHDIEHAVDFVEEIARVYGYDRFPSVLPNTAPPLTQQNDVLVWQARAKRWLAGMGVSEMYSNSFLSEKQLRSYGFTVLEAIELRNPLSQDQAFMRPSLVPTLLSAIAENQATFASADLFEIAPVYLPVAGEIPEQPLHLVCATYAKSEAQADALFLRVKGIFARLCEQAGVTEITFDRLVDSARYHAGRSARVFVHGHCVGTIGQVSRSVANAFGLDVCVMILELSFEAMVPFMSAQKTFVPLPQFPSVSRDIAFVLDDRVEYARLYEQLQKIHPSLEMIELFDVYRGKGIESGKKSMGIRLSFRATDRTLESKEVDVWMNAVREMLETQFHATMRM